MFEVDLVADALPHKLGIESEMLSPRSASKSLVSNSRTS